MGCLADGKRKISLKFEFNPDTLPTILLDRILLGMRKIGHVSSISVELCMYVHMSSMGYWNSVSQRTRQRYKSSHQQGL
jgi:hypothetical protein